MQGPHLGLPTSPGGAPSRKEAIVSSSDIVVAAADRQGISFSPLRSLFSLFLTLSLSLLARKGEFPSSTLPGLEKQQIPAHGHTAQAPFSRRRRLDGEAQPPRHRHTHAKNKTTQIQPVDDGFLFPTTSFCNSTPRIVSKLQDFKFDE